MPAGDPAPPALSEAFDRTVDALAAAGASYALIGGLAVAFHGLPRPTRDIDLLWSVPRIALPALLWEFTGRGFTFRPEEVMRELATNHLSRIHYQGVPVDLLEAVIPLFRRTVEGAREEEVRGRRVRIAAAEDLIALKMTAFREDDIRDVRGILATQGDRLDLEAIRRSVAECCGPDRMDALDRLLREARR